MLKSNQIGVCMGYRFRKSINLGGGFKINLSKSGIGYSWGIPGMRYSKLANGRERHTYSIPGTGISYVEDVSSGKKQQRQTYESSSSVGIVEEKVSSTDFEENSDYDEFINRINKFRNMDTGIKIIIILLSIISLFVLTNPIVIIIGISIFCMYLIYRNCKMLINVEYDFDVENEKFYELINDFFSTLASSSKLWIIESKYKNFDAKRNAGVDSCVERMPISIIQKIPYYLKTNIQCYCFSIKDKEFYFLPNKILVHDKNKTIGLNFQELSFEFNETTFVEQQGAPSDSEVVEYTYQYVNKKGGPDRRYKYNPQFPICLYGTVDIKNDDGLNLSILVSSKSKAMQARQIYETLRSMNVNRTRKCINCSKEISTDANFCKYCGTKQ